MGKSRLVILAVFIIKYLAYNGLLNAQSYKLVPVANWDKYDEGSVNKTRYNSCWGYTDIDSSEYAIVGGQDSIIILNISQPSNIKRVSSIYSGTKGCNNREFKTYAQFAFFSEDKCSNSAKFVIADLRDISKNIVSYTVLPDSIVARVHTIHIYKNYMYLIGAGRYIKDKNSGINVFEQLPLVIIDIANPLKYKVVQVYTQANFANIEEAHDIFMYKSFAFISCGPDGLYIYDLKLTSSPKLIQHIDIYPDLGYNHSSFVDTIGGYLYFTEETEGKRIKCYDINNILKGINTDYSLVSLFGFRPENAGLTHNMFPITDSLLYTSNYLDGVVLWNIKNPEQPKLFANYDTYPENDQFPNDDRYKNFNGVWNMYPYFNSNNVLAVDMTHGVFLFQLQKTNSIPISTKKLNFTYTQTEAELLLNFDQKITLQVKNISIYTADGKLVIQTICNENQAKVPLINLKSGVFIVIIQSGTKSSHLKIIR
ncbi:MAG: choice-of-anchor B family protein [Bacteroidota bacterium]|nr:choice-of-anchor B family protein [Bacteroidota bacterium]